jgi:hypothetical protein
LKQIKSYNKCAFFVFLYSITVKRKANKILGKKSTKTIEKIIKSESFITRHQTTNKIELQSQKIIHISIKHFKLNKKERKALSDSRYR